MAVASNIDRVLVSPYLRAQQTLEKVRLSLALPENVEMIR